MSTANPYEQTTSENEEKGREGCFTGIHFDLSKPLSRTDLQLFNQAIRSPTLMEIPEWWAKNAADRLVKDFQEATSKRQRQSITRSMMILCQHNLEVAKYAAVMLREQQLDDVPVSAPQSPALPAPESSPQERRKTLLDVSETMRLIHSDPKIAKLWDTINAQESREREGNG